VPLILFQHLICSQWEFETNVRYGQRVQWSCLLQGKDDQHKKPLWFGFKNIKFLAHFDCQNDSCSIFDWVLAMKFLLLAKFIQMLLFTPLP